MTTNNYKNTKIQFLVEYPEYVLCEFYQSSKMKNKINDQYIDFNLIMEFEKNIIFDEKYIL